MRDELEEARERRFWGAVLRVLGTSLVVLSALGALAAPAVLLGWWRHPLPCVLGLLAGAALSVAMTASPRGRELTAIALGAVTLPALAAHLAAVGAGSEAALEAYRARLVPFLAHAAGGLAGGLGVAALWWRRAGPPPSAEDEAGAREPGAADAPSPAAANAAGRGAGPERERTRLEGASR